jgi:hypothetical protein
VRLSVMDKIGKKFSFVRSPIVILEPRPAALPGE